MGYYLLNSHVADSGRSMGTKFGLVPAAVSIEQNSIAVLPFSNLSDDKENEYFSDGISEELLTALQRVAGLHVAARPSSFSFKGTKASAQEIGQKLGVSHLIEGSVRKSGESVRIAARLSRARSGEQIWADSYTRDVRDVFGVQSELAQTIVEQLRGHIGEQATASARVEIRAQILTATKGGTRNPDAHQLYLQGLFYLHQYSPENVRKATSFFERSVAMDPGFALAWAALSRAGADRGANAATKREFDEGFALARRAADRALAISPELTSAHLARMTVQMSSDFDWKGAAESLRRAQSAAPADSEVLVAAASLAYAFGRREAAVELAQQALERDALNAWTRSVLGFALNSVGRYKEAEAQFRRVMELSPAAPFGHAGIGYIFLSEGRYDEALLEAAQETTEWTRLTVQVPTFWALKKRRESDAALARLIAGYSEISAFQIAQAYAFRRDSDKAFEWLARAAAQRDPGVAWCRSDPILRNLHNDPRWAAFLRGVGLADDQLR
jgi:adenylate cyclase